LKAISAAALKRRTPKNCRVFCPCPCFANLQDFLNLYYEIMQVLHHEEDFYELTKHYIDKIQTEAVRHVEIFFDPQMHMERGVKFETIVTGLLKGISYAFEKYGITAHLIPCVLRDLPLTSAAHVLKKIIHHKDHFLGIGLDSAEQGYPPHLFNDLFLNARKEGLLTFAHAGEEGPPAYIWEAIELLKVRRIDHGVRATEDESLMNYLANTRIPLTTCPLSNIKLKVFSEMRAHPIKKFLSYNICATISSDDPAYFGGYINWSTYSCNCGVFYYWIFIAWVFWYNCFIFLASCKSES
jgi:adenosine deaminase